MKVYIVVFYETTLEHDDNEIIAVYLSEAKAQERCNEENRDMTEQELEEAMLWRERGYYDYVVREVIE